MTKTYNIELIEGIRFDPKLDVELDEQVSGMISTAGLDICDLEANQLETFTRKELTIQSPIGSGQATTWIPTDLGMLDNLVANGATVSDPFNVVQVDIIPESIYQVENETEYAFFRTELIKYEPHVIPIREHEAFQSYGLWHVLTEDGFFIDAPNKAALFDKAYQFQRLT